jgi:hypothetical protein
MLIRTVLDVVVSSCLYTRRESLAHFAVLQFWTDPSGQIHLALDQDLARSILLVPK